MAYEYTRIYRDNGAQAMVQTKNVQDWVKKGWTTEKPGGAVVDAYKKRQKDSLKEDAK